MRSVNNQTPKVIAGTGYIGGSAAILPFFPAGFPYELLVSRVGRYHILRGHATSQVTYDEIFQSAPFSLTHWAPQYLDRLAARIPGDFDETVESMYRDSTILPLFEHFFGERVPLGVNSAGASAMAGLPRRIVGESGTTHLCTICLAEDTDEYGTPYIHLTHQIPTSTICWRHGVRLIDRCPHCRCPFEVPKDLILVPWRGCPCGRSLLGAADLSLPKPTEIEISLARFGKELLDCTPIRLDSLKLVELYRTRVLELGFKRGKTIDRVSLLSALEDHIGKKLLADMDWAYSKGRMSGWFHLLSPSLSAETPLTRHLVFAHFLFREAGAFISQLEVASTKPAAVKRGSQNNKSASSSELIERLPTNLIGDEALNRLVLIGRKNHFSVDDLWKAEYASMKKLVKSQPNAVQAIEARLALTDDSPKLKRNPKSNSSTTSKDANWADAIQLAADSLYSEVGKPKRVSVNSLLKKAGIRLAVWPSPQSSPLTHAKCDGLKESAWHFYARRMLWTMTHFAGNPTAKAMIAMASGLEYFKASDVLTFFVEMGYRPTAEPYAKQLENLGIPKNWSGPHPERKYESVGRAYVRKALRKRMCS